MKFCISLSSLILLLLCSACKKDENTEAPPAPVTNSLSNGLPADMAKIHAYLTASARTSSFSSGSPYYNFVLYAAFGDPARNLMSMYNHYSEQIIFNSNTGRPNISVGTVKCNNISIPAQEFGNEVRYEYNPGQVFSPVPNSITWKSDGNGSFLPLNEPISRGLPLIQPPAQSYTIDPDHEMVFDLAGLCTNYDSLAVTVFMPSSSFQNVTKSVGSGITQISFSSAELYFLNNSWTQSTQIRISAFNYSTRTINGKVYLFENGQKLDLTATVIQN